MVQLMWYTTKVGPGTTNAAREFAVNMSYPGPEYCKSLRYLIGYLKGKKTKPIIIIKPKIIKAEFL